MEWKQDNEMPGKSPWDKEKAWASSLHTTNTLFRGNCHFSDSVEDIGHLWQRTYQGLERRCEVRTHKSLANNLLNGAIEKNDSKIQNKVGGGHHCWSSCHCPVVLHKGVDDQWQARLSMACLCSDHQRERLWPLFIVLFNPISKTPKQTIKKKPCT